MPLLDFLGAARGRLSALLVLSLARSRYSVDGVSVTAEQVAAWFAVDQNGRSSPNVHRVMGVRGERVTLASQQMRAHNLAWALHEQGLLTGQTVGVVGGGMAGLTFGVICAQLGASVVLYEQAGRLLPTQWKSFDRYLHPGLFHSPQGGWDNGRTTHPVLGWRDHFAAAVRDGVLSHVPIGNELDLEFRLGTFVTGIDALAARPEVSALFAAAGKLEVDRKQFDQVVVAAGFAMERPVPGAFGGSYWRSQCDASSIPPDRDVGIVGNGDGALTELMSLSLPGFRQDRLRDFVGTLHGLPSASMLAADTDPDLHDYLKRHLAGASHLVTSMGRIVDDLDVSVTSKDHRLRAGSFAVNRCAAVAIELAQQQRGRPAIFEPPLDKDYDRSWVATDPRAIVWRVGPRDCEHLLHTFDLDVPASRGGALAPTPKRQGPETWEPQWRRGRGLSVNTVSQRTRRPGCHDTELPEQPMAPPVADDSGGTSGLHATLTDRSDAVEALLTLAAAARTLERAAGDDPPILDWSAVRNNRQDGHVLLSLDAVAAVASLPPVVVLDELRNRGTPLHTFGEGLLMARVDAAAIDVNRNGAFWDSAVHVAIDAQRVRLRLLSPGRRDIDPFIDDADLAGALALAIRARRRRTDLPAAVLTRIAARPLAPGEAPDHLSPLLLLVAIALTPGPDAGGQGRLGLLALGRAALRSRWVAERLAQFVGLEGPDPAAQIGARFVLVALRQIVSPLRPRFVLPMTIDFVTTWLATAAPRRVTNRRQAGLDLDEEFVARLRDIVEPAIGRDQTAHTDVRSQVEALLGALPGGPVFASAEQDDVILRRFGLAAARPDDAQAADPEPTNTAD